MPNGLPNTVESSWPKPASTSRPGYCAKHNGKRRGLLGETLRRPCPPSNNGGQSQTAHPQGWCPLSRETGPTQPSPPELPRPGGIATSQESRQPPRVPTKSGVSRQVTPRRLVEAAGCLASASSRKPPDHMPPYAALRRIRIEDEDDSEALSALCPPCARWHFPVRHHAARGTTNDENGIGGRWRQPFGVRPSSGAATALCSRMTEQTTDPWKLDIAAPEDGRPPAQSVFHPCFIRGQAHFQVRRRNKGRTRTGAGAGATRRAPCAWSRSRCRGSQS